MNAHRLYAAKRLGAVPVVVVLVSAAAAFAPAAASAASYSVGTPSVDAITGAPWTPSQGVPYFDNQAIPNYPAADLLPTFSFAGQSTSATNSAYTTTQTITTGSVTSTTTTTTPVNEPNVAVYPGVSGSSEPDVSGYVGTPGPLSGYCLSSETDTANDNDAVNFTNPLGTFANLPQQETSGDQPFSPYYFPQVVQTPGTTSSQDLTGYFDWRPKDGDEAVVVANSTDGGLTWNFEGKALDQNGNYCPSADTNDDGQGHPYVADLGSGSTSDLYTLQRAAGDYAGTNLLVDPVNPSAANPLSAAPSTASIGVDPNTFATGATQLSAGTPENIPVSTLGGDTTYGNSTNSLVSIPDPSALPTGNAEYEDITQGSEGSGGVTPPIVSCTGTNGTGTNGLPNGGGAELTGCTSSSGIEVGANDDLVEVIGTASAAFTVPAGPNNQGQTAGLKSLVLTPTSANSDTLTYLLNNNAPNRYYIDGNVVYCAQANADPTTTIEYCTSPSGQFTGKAGDAVIADPIIPTATGGGPVGQTNGLISPDGIIGALPSTANAAWGEPSTGHVVLYTEKLVNYFIEGGINGTVLSANASSYFNYKTDTAGVFASQQTGTSSVLQTGFVAAPGTTKTNYNISPFPTESESLPTSGPFTIYVGGQTASTTGGPAGSGAELDTLSCTGWDVNTHIADLYNPNLNTIDLIGCTGGVSTDGFNAGHQGNWVAGPGASIEMSNSSKTSVLQQIGEGKALTKGQAQKLFGNNEDYEVVRAAYTTDGGNFTDLGPISGSTSGAVGSAANASQTCPAGGSGAPTTAGATTVGYTDITDPCQQDAPSGSTTFAGGPAAFDSSNPQGTSPASLPQGTADAVELRWPGARGTIVTNPDGTIGLFLSGAWASDGDSDAFNQVYYTESSDGGKTWSTPTVVLSTDYTFSASVNQDNALANGSYPALGVSAYYSGRAYDPTVVQNADGSLTLVFAGYRLPNPVKAAGTFIGTNTASTTTGSATEYEEGTVPFGTTAFETDPAIYRNILTTTLAPQTPTALISEWRPVGPGGAANDDYVDIANNSSAALDVNSWSLRFINSTGTVESESLSSASGSIPVSGHLLAADSGYDSTLSAVAAPDVNYTLPANYVPVGVELLNAAGDVVDSVGFTNVPAGYSGYYEGTGLNEPSSWPTGQFAYVRSYSNGSLVNSHDNVADFSYVSTTNAGQATYGSPTAGVPGPLELGSPTNVNSFLQISQVDPSVGPQASPNTVYDGTGGNLSFNFKVTNCSGQPATGVCVNAASSAAYDVTVLQFRVTSLSSSLLAEASAGGTFSDGTTSFTTDPLSLLPPATSTGGLNSVLVGTADLPTGGLGSGGSIDVEVSFKAPTAPTHFSYSFGINTEDDFVPVSPSTGSTAATPPSPVGSGASTPNSPGALSGTPIQPEVSGTVGPSGVTVVVQPVTKKHVVKKAKKHAKHKAKKHGKKHAKHKAKKHTKRKATTRHAG